MKSFNRTLVLDSSEKYEKKQNQFANLDKVWEKFMVDVCGACDIPMTRLFGQSPGGLNATGTGDLENYYTRINADQSTRLKPKLDYFDEIFVRSVLGIKPVDYAYKFNSLWQISDKDRAAIEYQDAQRDQIYLQSGVVSEGLVASQLRLKGTYATMSDEDVRMAEELSEEMDSFQSEQRTKLTKPTAEEEPDEPAATSKEDK
jgi:phage-related protein (TIGR01555 family)